MKRKAVTGFLAAGLVIAPAHSQQGTNDPQLIITFECSCLLMFDALMICVAYDCWQNARHQPIEMTSPPPENFPPIGGANAPPDETNEVPRMRIVAHQLASADCAAFSWPDTNGGANCIFTNFATGMVQRGDTLDGFHDWLRINAWLSPNGKMVQVAGSDGPIACSYAAYGQTNIVRLPGLKTGRVPQQFYRLLSQ